MLGTLNPAFDVKESQIFLDNAPEVPDPVQKRMEFADERVNVLNQDARKAQFEADTLCLARDLAQIGSIYKEVEKTEHAKRTEKLVHLRAQNTIGAAIVSEFMGQNMAVMSGVLKEQLAAIDRVWGCENLRNDGKKGMNDYEISCEHMVVHRVLIGLKQHFNCLAAWWI